MQKSEVTRIDENKGQEVVAITIYAAPPVVKKINFLGAKLVDLSGTAET